MGIEASYRRITPDEWAGLQRLSEGKQHLSGFDLEEAYLEFSHSDQMMSSERYFSLDKDWHALHALITGDFSNPSEIKPFPAPLGHAIMGGTETPFDATYGKVRVLNPEEVREVAEALRKITVDDLRSRMDLNAFNKAPIYPNPRPGGWDLMELEGVLDIFPLVVDYFHEAARAGNVVLLSFD